MQKLAHLLCGSRLINRRNRDRPWGHWVGLLGDELYSPGTRAFFKQKGRKAERRQQKRATQQALQQYYDDCIEDLMDFEDFEDFETYSDLDPGYARYLDDLEEEAKAWRDYDDEDYPDPYDDGSHDPFLSDELSRLMLRTHISDGQLRQFVEESNALEGIYDLNEAVLALQVATYAEIILMPDLTLERFEKNVYTMFGGELRKFRGMDVYAGNHIPPPGSSTMIDALEELLDLVFDYSVSSTQFYCMYQNTHPFTDGNGRSGRLLWLRKKYWDSLEGFSRCLERGFLRSWHLETLQEYDKTHVRS